MFIMISKGPFLIKLAVVAKKFHEGDVGVGHLVIPYIVVQVPQLNCETLRVGK